MTGTMKELRDMKWVAGTYAGQLVFTAQQLDIVSTAFAGTEAEISRLTARNAALEAELRIVITNLPFKVYAHQLAEKGASIDA